MAFRARSPTVTVARISTVSLYPIAPLVSRTTSSCASRSRRAGADRRRLRRERERAIATWTAVAAVGGAAGLVLGGVIGRHARLALDLPRQRAGAAVGIAARVLVGQRLGFAAAGALAAVGSAGLLIRAEYAIRLVRVCVAALILIACGPLIEMPVR